MFIYKISTSTIYDNFTKQNGPPTYPMKNIFQTFNWDNISPNYQKDFNMP
jgi:hypothetical protein